MLHHDFWVGGNDMGFSPFGGFSDMMFIIVPIFILIVFTFVIVMIIASFVRGAKQWKRNNDSPVLTVDAAMVTKRTNVHRYHHDTGTDHMHHTSSSTTYYATFEVASGDRLEFEIRDTEYGMLAENDMGTLTFQGTRYLGFERNRS